jgi:hypothetical protein
VYIEVDDPQRYMDRATKAGATMIMPVTQITPDTTIGMFRDPAGNVNGILKANAEATRDPRAAAQGAQRRTSRARSSTRAKSAAKRGAKKSTRRATTARKSTRSTGRRKRR